MSDETTPDLTALLADQFGEWLHRMHGVVSSCDHRAEAEGMVEALAAAGFGPVRAVEAERDAARREERMRAEDHVNAWREVAIVTARAESAEAALAELREGIEALCDPANEGPRPYAVALDNDVILAVDTAYLRALLAPTPDRDPARDE